ncbi:hypothetical protein EBT31_10455 [bacterium]|jgi:hypothetical protein|nr:hypothetical protein [bacterium]
MSELFEAASASFVRDLKRHISPDAIRGLAESMRREEPSGALGTLSLYILDELEELVKEQGESKPVSVVISFLNPYPSAPGERKLQHFPDLPTAQRMVDYYNSMGAYDAKVEF